MSKTNRKYLCADLLGCLAVILILGVQYIQKTGFVEMPVTYESVLPIAARWFCLSGAMLLSACTGYVLSTKELSWRSARPFFRVLYIYLVCSLGAMAVRRVLFEEALDLQGMLTMLYQFTATNTAKFAGMYLFILLLAPFLSAAFRDLKTREARFEFLAVLTGISTLQPMLIISGNYLLPEWCKMLSPLAGFVGGAFVRRYAKNHSRFFYFFWLLVVCAAQTAAVVYICTDRGILYYPQFDSMASLPSLLIALLTLSLFHSRQRKDNFLTRFFSLASGGALCALILGETLMDFLLPSIEEQFPDKLLVAGFAAVPVIFILCGVTGLFLQIPVFIFRAVFVGDDDEYEDDVEEELPKGRKVSKPQPLRTLEPIVSNPEPVAEPVSAPAAEIRPEPVAEPVAAPTMVIRPEPAPTAVIEPEPVPEPVPAPAEPAPIRKHDEIDDLIAQIENKNQ